LWDSAPELVSNQTAIQHVFLVVKFFAIRLYNCNDSHLDMSDLHFWLSGQSVALYQQEIAALIQMVCFCPNGKGAPKLFKSLEPKPSLSQSHH
jgi:hypothetical protein